MLVQESMDLPFQPGQIIFNRRPDHLQIHAKIFMNEKITHVSHIRPWNLRMLDDKIRISAVDVVRGILQ